MSDQPTVHEALALVMGDVQAVRKSDRNTHQNYNFRGIDAVVNAVGPKLRERNVVVLPRAESVEYETYKSTGGAMMTRCVVKVRFVFVGPAGDTLECVTYGEAADSGDKSTPKAHSVAFRTALLQALCIPTDEADPDAGTHERAVPVAAGPPLPDGWSSEQDWLDAWTELRADTHAIPDEDARAAVQAWARDQKITKNALTGAAALAWRQQIDAATPVEVPA